MKKVAFLALFCLIGLVQINAQEEDYFDEDVRTVVKFSFLNLMDFWNPAIQFGVEYRIAKNFYFQNEAGYLFSYNFDTADFNDPNVQSSQGYRLRHEARYYPLGNGDRLFNFYINAQATWRQSFEDRSGTFCQADCTFFREIDYDYRMTAIGLTSGVGFQLVFDSGFTMDFSASPGLRWITTSFKGVPDDAELRDQFWNGFDPIWRNEPGNYNVPNFVLGFKLGYAIR